MQASSQHRRLVQFPLERVFVLHVFITCTCKKGEIEVDISVHPAGPPLLPSHPMSVTSDAPASVDVPVSEALVSPSSRLRDYIVWFMTGERLSERLMTSDGQITALHVEWNGTLAAVELRFSNGMTTHPWYVIEGLTSDDADVVAAEVASGTTEWLVSAQASARSREPSLKVDVQALHFLEREASCKLTIHEALVLQRSKQQCPICLGRFAKHQTVLCLPCGRAEEASECLGHLGHAKCLRAEFHRRDACPLCRTQLPGHDDAAALERARANLCHLRCEAALLHSKNRSASPHANPSSNQARGGAGGSSASALPAPGCSTSSSSSRHEGSGGGGEGATSSARGEGGMARSGSEQQRQARSAAKQRDEERRWREARRAALRGRPVSV